MFNRILIMKTNFKINFIIIKELKDSYFFLNGGKGMYFLTRERG